MSKNKPSFLLDISSDLAENINEHLEESLIIHKSFLSKNQYINKDTKKKSIFIHHTAGWNNPYSTINSWERDTRGAVGTHYVIGGINPVTGDTKYDGVVVQCVPDEKSIWHLGVSKINKFIDKESIGIELCNFGYLSKKDDEFFTYVNSKIKKSYAVELSNSFRSKKYWHAYTENQLRSLKSLIKILLKHHDINKDNGLPKYLREQDKYTAFDYKKEILAVHDSGIYTHTNVRKDKFDCYPDDGLVDVLLNL